MLQGYFGGRGPGFSSMSPDISSKQEHIDVYLGLMLMRFVNDTCRYARSERTQVTSDLHSCSTPESSERRYGNLADSSSDELRDGVQRRSSTTTKSG